MADDPLPPLPKPKYGLLKPQPLTHQQVNNPSGSEINSQEKQISSDPDAPQSVVSMSKPSSSITYTTGYHEQERYQPEQGKSRLGKDIETEQYVDVPQYSRRQGLYIIGIQGTGKSVLIENLIIQDISQDRGVCVLDPHGDLINAVLARMDRRVEDVILLDILDYLYPFGLNLFECSNLSDPVEVQKTVDQVIHIFDRLFEVTRTTPLIIQYLRNCTHTLIANPGYTMADIPLLLRNKNCRSRLVANVKDRNVVGFWQDYEDMKPSDQRSEREPILRRLEELLQPLTFNIVGQSTTTINIKHVMDEGKILLVKLSARLPYVSSLIGSILVALFLNAATTREANKRRQFNLYADEFQRFATEDFATLLEEARKFGLSINMAHQNGSQLEPSLKERARSVANLVVFQVSRKDADELAGGLAQKPDEARIEMLKPQEHRRVEEQLEDGEEPIKVYKRNITDHLLKQGHEDERVMQFVRTYLRSISLRAEARGRDNESIAQEAQLAIIDLNDWLYEGMVNLNKLFQSLPLSIFNALFLPNFNYISIGSFYRNKNFYRLFCDFWFRFREVDESYLHGIGRGVRLATEKMLEEYSDVTKKLPDKVGASHPQTAGGFHALRSGLFSQSQFHSLYQDAVEKYALYEAKLVVTEELDERERAFQKLKVWEREGKERGWRETGRTIQGKPGTPEYGYTMYEVEPDLPPGEYERWIEREKQHKQEQIDQGYSLFDAFTESLQLCQYALSQNPLMTTESGLYQPRKRTQVNWLTDESEKITHPQRTEQDMVNEMARILTNLPLYTARVKVVTGNGIEEHTIRTLDPKQSSDRLLFGQALQDRIASIKKQNMKVGYLRERAAVEADIRTRQEQYNQPPEIEPPISRHPPR